MNRQGFLRAHCFDRLNIEIGWLRLRWALLTITFVRVLGIDPGSETTGWGVVEGDARRYEMVAFGVVRASARERFAARLLKISAGVEAALARYRPDVCAVEEAFFAVNVKTALKLGQV